MRARDALGRPVPAGSPGAVDPVPEVALPPDVALRTARELLAGGRAFGAHEVCEAVWKACAPPERPLWQGLAQACVGLTHLQRGNRTGAARLLRRAASTLADYRSAGYDAGGLGLRCLALAGLVEGGGGADPGESAGSADGLGAPVYRDALAMLAL